MLTEGGERTAGMNIEGKKTREGCSGGREREVEGDGKRREEHTAVKV